jgi:RimJ/RimL family protein N-acetyltransferase
MTLDIPLLETERLVLRAPAERDFEPEVAFYASQRSRHVGGPLPRDLVWRALAASLGHWLLRGYGYWALDDKETGAYCGRVGLWSPESWPEPEVSWSLMPEAEGRGLAREAALRVRAYAYQVLNWTTAISMIAPENTRSIALAERLGARFESEYEHPSFGWMNIYRHPSPEPLT